MCMVLCNYADSIQNKAILSDFRLLYNPNSITVHGTIITVHGTIIKCTMHLYSVGLIEVSIFHGSLIWSVP